MLIIIILILINKGLFEPIYKDLKFMVQNRSYICTSLITHFSYLGHGVSLHGCSSKAQPLLLTATPPDLECGIAPLGPLAPVQPPLLGLGLLLPAAAPDLGHGVAPLGHSCTVAAWHSRLLPLTSDVG